MPSLSTIGLASLAAVSTLASAAPADNKPISKRWSEGDPGCMTWDDAQTVVNHWGELLTSYSDALANEYLTPGIIDYSESVNTLINTCPQGGAQPLPLLAATFANRDLFEAGQGKQPPINFEQLQMWHTCSSVTARWKTTNTVPADKVANVKPVVGIFVLETVPVDGGYQVDRAYSEFDAGAWLQNLQEAGICGASGDAVPDPSASVASSAPAAAVTTAAAVVPPPAGSSVAPAADTTTYGGNTTAWRA